MAKQQTRGSIGTYRRPGAARAAFDPAGTILEGIESAEKDITSRIKTVRDFENAAATRRQETLDALADTEGMKDFTALDSLQQDLMKEIDELYKLDIASFEGDRSAYLKKQNEMQRVIGDIPALMGLIDQEAELMKENEGAGGSDYIKKYLKSNNEDYYNFVNNASKGGDKISFRIQNGNIIAQLDGKDVFNGHAYINAKKDGYDLVEYAGDYTKEIDDADVRAYRGLDALVTTEITEKVQNGTKLTKEEIKDYTLAKQKYRERLESGQIALPINESTYQMFTTYGEDNITPYGETEGQGEQTKAAIIDYMVENRFPEDTITTKITEESGALLSQYQKRVLADKDKQRELVEKMDQELKDSLKTDLSRNVKHAREAYYGAKGELGSEERANFISNVLNEAGGNTSVEKEGNVYKVFDPAGEIQGVDTFKGLVDLLNKLTIFDITDADKPLSQKDVNARDIYVKTYIAGAINEMGEIEQIYKPRNAEEQKAAIEQMKPGDAIITIDGQFMRKSKENANNASRFNK